MNIVKCSLPMLHWPDPSGLVSPMANWSTGCQEIAGEMRTCRALRWPGGCRARRLIVRRRAWPTASAWKCVAAAAITSLFSRSTRYSAATLHQAITFGRSVTGVVLFIQKSLCLLLLTAVFANLGKVRLQTSCR